MATTELAVPGVPDPNPPAPGLGKDGDQSSHQTPGSNSSNNSTESTPSARKNFGFDPVTFKIPPRNPTSAVLKEIYSCRDSLQNPDDLLIVSYIGHGDLSTRGTLVLFPYR